VVFPIKLCYIFTTKVTVLTKLNNMPLKALVITLLMVVTTLGISGDTSIRDTNLQLVIVKQLLKMVN